MIDRGLLASLAVVAIAVAVAGRIAPPRAVHANQLWDVAFAPLAAGVVAARLVAVSLDDPRALGTLRDLLIIRGGMHLWAGVAAAALAAAWSRRRDGRPAGLRFLADLAPYGLWAHAAYEGTCVLRDGCFGPPAPIGLRPLGLPETQFPVGLAVAVAVAGVGVVVRRLGRQQPVPALLLAVGGLATVRYVAAFWLPRVSTGPSRQQLESLVVALLVLVAAGAAWGMSRPRRRGPAPA